MADADTCATTIRLLSEEDGSEVEVKEDSIFTAGALPPPPTMTAYDLQQQFHRQRVTFLKSDLENFRTLVETYRSRPAEEQTQTLSLLLNSQANAHLSNLVELTGAYLLAEADLVQLQVEKQFLTTLLFELAPKVETVSFGLGENNGGSGHHPDLRLGFPHPHPFHRFPWWAPHHHPPHHHRGGDRHFTHKLFKKMSKEKCYDKLEKKLAKKEKKLMEKCAKRLRKMKVK